MIYLVENDGVKLYMDTLILFLEIYVMYITYE